MKKLIILGSTGSIGTQTLDVVRDVVRRNPAAFKVVGLAANQSAASLAAQAHEFAPQALSMTDTDAAASLSSPLPLFSGPDAATRLVQETEADMVVAAMSGAAGLGPVLAAIHLGRDIALANKETLVMAGALVKRAASSVRLLPVDSEHSAIFQAIQGSRPQEVESITLTASGGALRDMPPDQWHHVTPEQALRHPNWSMGPKITIDSASLMNKALEIIEAHWLFSLPPDRIKVLMHPESLIHSMVTFCDGSVLAQLGLPDMRIPIQYALTYPRRLPSSFPRLNLAEFGSLHFSSPRHYRALDLAYEVLQQGGSAGAVFNAANEIAVAAFLEGRIKFTGITDIVAETLDRHGVSPEPDLGEILEHDEWARRTARSLVD